MTITYIGEYQARMNEQRREKLRKSHNDEKIRKYRLMKQVLLS